MMKSFFGYVALCLLPLVAACSHGGVVHLEKDETAASKKGVITMWADWVKDKGNKYDVNFNMRNESDKSGMIVLLSDMSCKRGTETGEIKYTFFNTGERIIDFKPNQKKSFNMVCHFPTKARGAYSIAVAKVYDNPSMDGKSLGAVIGENVVWKFDEPSR